MALFMGPPADSARQVEARRLVAIEAPQDAITIPAIVTGPADGPFAADFAQAGNRATCTGHQLFTGIDTIAFD